MWAFAPIPSDGKIQFYKRDQADFGFLSNYCLAPVEINGVNWPHIEAYYQSRKSENPAYHARILEREKPSWSKYVGDSRIGHPRLSKKSWFRKRPQDFRADWEQVKVDEMRIALRAKFTQHTPLRLSLLATGSAKIIEDCSTDFFWGVGEDGSGENWLGRLLMALRTDLARR